MHLATLKRGGRDGVLVAVARDHATMTVAPAGLPTLQAALDDWARAASGLREVEERMATGHVDCEPLVVADLHSPLPRAYQWAEASTYHAHMERLRKARKIELPPEHGAEPAVFNSGSDAFLAPRDPIPLADEAWGLDLEATVAVITDDVPRGITVEQAAAHIKLVILANDLTLRNILPHEYAKGVGFFQSKPLRTLGPIAVTPDSLGRSWSGALLHATVRCWVNDEQLGALDAGCDCAFDFARVIAHLTRTRPLAAGTIVSSGTIANRDAARGFGALAEKRAVEMATSGRATTTLLRCGDRVRIEAFDREGRSLFGAIDQCVVAHEPATVAA